MWHYQVVHHDLWDRDLPAAPALVRVTRDGKKVDAVAQITKSGHVFLFERETGKPLFPIEERIVAALRPRRGERLADPAPAHAAAAVLPAAPHRGRPQRPRSGGAPGPRGPLPQASARAGQWIPPSREGTIIFPGFDGGGEWGGAAFDEDSGLLYVNANEMPWMLTLVPIDRTTESTDHARGRVVYQQYCVACHGVDRKGDPQGQYPGIVDVDKKMPREEVDRIVTSGQGVMPSFAMLTPRQRRSSWPT